MSDSNFKCENCSKEFLVRFLWFKPKEVNCPYCGSNKVNEVKGCSSCGSSNKENKGGFTFG